ncbi:MAG: gliding motility-associated C-terminal domain-containing protein [Gelidibacter sp.]
MIKQMCLYSRKDLFIALIFLILGCVDAFSQCPTVSDPTQTFCDIQSPIVSNLVATDNGNGVVWYATATSSTPLSGSTGLINGEDYYADDNSGTCGSRQRVDVVIYGSPVGLNFQGVCVDDPMEATIADLIASGNDIRWYNVPTGGVALSPSTILMDNTIYYADQANPVTGCRTSRLSVFVNVGVVPVPIGDAIQEFCFDQQPVPTVADLVASGASNNWYNTLSSASPLDPSTPLVDGASYFATTVDPPCESMERLEVLVVFNMPNDPGTNGVIEICETNVTTTQTVDLFDGLNGTPMTGGIWTGPFPTTNGSIGTVDITAMTVMGSPYLFTYTVEASAGCSQTSATVAINIIPPPNAGTNGSVTFCGNGSPVDLFTVLGGTPDTGGTWSPALASGTGLFDPSVDAAGTYTYTVTGTPPCSNATATVTVTITPSPNAGTNGSVAFCENGMPVDLFDSLGGTPDAGGTWSPALASGTGLFDPAVDAAGTYTYTVTGTPPCTDATATVTVTILSPPNAGTNGSLDICESGLPEDLFDSLGGTPDAGGAWSPTLASGTGLFDPTIDAAGTYTYTVTGSNSCTASSTVVVTIVLEPNAGNDSAVAFCSNGSPMDLFNSLGGTPDAGGTWSPALASGTGIFDPSVDSAGIYTYTVDAISPCRGSSSSIVNVSINQEPNVMDATISVENVCLGLETVVTIANATLLVDGNYTITYNLSGSNISQNNTITTEFIGGSTSFIIPETQLTNSGTTTITITQLIFVDTQCSADVSAIASAQFDVFDAPTPTLISGGNSFCTEDSPTIQNLSANIIETQTITWYDAPTDGTAYQQSEPLIDGVTYYASLTTSEGCESLIRLAVTVNISMCQELELIIPDGFSPNGDGTNDDFDIVNIRQLYPNFTLEIFNRYGNVLYKGNKDIPNWDGTSKESSGFGNSVLPVGVYFYILEFNDGAKKPLQGRVYLSR